MLYKQNAQTLVCTWLLVRVFWLQIIENLDSSWLKQQGCLLFDRTKTAQGRWSPGMILQAVYSWLILLALPCPCLASSFHRRQCGLSGSRGTSGPSSVPEGKRTPPPVSLF